jgi:hypothetical protein
VDRKIVSETKIDVKKKRKDKKAEQAKRYMTPTLRSRLQRPRRSRGGRDRTGRDHRGGRDRKVETTKAEAAWPRPPRPRPQGRDHRDRIQQTTNCSRKPKLQTQSPRSFPSNTLVSLSLNRPKKLVLLNHRLRGTHHPRPPLPVIMNT